MAANFGMRSRDDRIKTRRKGLPEGLYLYSYTVYYRMSAMGNGFQKCEDILFYFIFNCTPLNKK